MELIYSGYAGSYDAPPEPAVWADDFGYEGLYGDKLITFPDGLELFFDEVAGMSALKFVKEFAEHLDAQLIRARNNSVWDIYDRKIRKGSSYWRVFDTDFAFKSLKDKGLEEFLRDDLDLPISKFEIIAEEPDYYDD